MVKLFKNQKALLFAMAITATISFQCHNVDAQVKVGDNPHIINAGSALEIEANDKGLLLPRVSLFKTDVWGLAGTPVTGMQVYNINGEIFGTDAHPIIQQGSGVYYWDGSGWVGTKPKPATGDFDWLISGDNTNPSDPADINKPIYHNGNVGIRTTSPSSPLQVTGVITQASSELADVSNNRITIGNGGIDIFDKTGITNGYIDFKDNSNEDFDARIAHHNGVGTEGALMITVASQTIAPGIDAITILNENGNVGIDKTSPAYKLDVRGEINADGKVRSGGIALTSDVRLKRNIQAFDNGLDIVSKLKPVSYEKKALIANNDYDKKEIGFIAQEVQKILPQLVSEGKDADKTLALDYNSLIPILTRAIQEQQALIEKMAVERAVEDAKLDYQSCQLEVQRANLIAQSAEINEIKQMLRKGLEGSSNSQTTSK
ncbi:tail fiber domain-containing protein [Dyadobacter sp. CY347]|uniref:tail fiber domain-containing protein n=1 Tax=Dyadobacter sp. CY347 TaxID=2909336 RepID=UPI001F46E74E|nr:tail fiber domain-containing protein [Dyadobacter sp. CY347]MCF2491453.1 tail fiber domain-containing protein [Dyadobacter sp. CY347]